MLVARKIRSMPATAERYAERVATGAIESDPGQLQVLGQLARLETTLANNPEREPGVIDVSTSEVTL